MAVVNSRGRTLAFPGMLALAMLVLAVLLLAGLAPAAHAAGFDLDFFKPVAVSTGYFSEETSRILPAGSMDLGLSFGYARQPLVRRDQLSGNVGDDVVKDRFTGYLTAAFGIANRIDIGFRIPAVLRQTGDVDVDVAVGGGILQRPRDRAFGDIDLLPRLRMVGAPDGSGFNLTLSAPFGLPTGAPDALAGNGRVSFRPRVIAGWESYRLSGAASVGYDLRRPTEVPSSNLVVGNAVAGGAGIAYAVVPRQVWVLCELGASVGLSQSDTGAMAIPAELMTGARVILAERFVIQGGIGTGLNHAPGSPRFRGLFSVSYVGTPLPP